MAPTRNIRIITWVYWFLLLYVVAALLFWLVSLENQNDVVTDLKIQVLQGDEPGYQQKLASIKDVQRRKTIQYIGEGITFLVVILVGAAFVYRSIRKQLRLSRQEKNFMMAITHELKTPIAITQLNLETIQKRKLDPEQTSRLLANTLKEVNRLNELCDNILFSAQLDGSLQVYQKTKLDFSDLLQAVIANFTSRYPQLNIQAAVQPEIVLEADQLACQILISNLLENAIKYGGVKSTIVVKLSKQAAIVSLVIADNGPGVHDDEKNKVFEKFYRVGNENTRTAKGTGLGLYICKRIVERHDGKITITDNIPNGAVFTVELTAVED